ncbi:ABC transporter ATP-binding protein [bacterium]|nr:ABC transporter ATP-binding protein [bacterium]MBR2652497.1 ABC transporter ATP-binding protein [bacterium]
MYPIINMSMSWAVILTIYVGVSSKAIDVANIGSIMSVTTLILFGMVLMINVILQYGIALGSCNRVREVLDKQPSIIFKENGLQIDKPVIKFENVNFKYNETGEYVLKDINLTINEDETIGIIGATGSGKSTFVSLITRMYDVKEGKLSISNIDIKDIDKHSLRNQISLSPQRVTLFSGTIASNLKYGKNDATLEEMKEAAKGAEAYEFIMQKPGEFNATVEQRGRNFSGGQQQRLSIARALIKKPKILILDSSTSALDMITEKKVNEYIKETNKGRTTIVISQRISGVRSADRILVFEKGKIAGVGSHIELLRNNPIYREIALSQLGKEGVESELGQR